MKKLLHFEIYKLLRNKISIFSIVIIIIGTLVSALLYLNPVQKPIEETYDSDTYYSSRIHEIEVLTTTETGSDATKHEYEKQIYLYLKSNKIAQDSWQKLYALTIPDLMLKGDEFIDLNQKQEADKIRDTIESIYTIIREGDWYSYLNNMINESEVSGENEKRVQIERYLLAFRKKANIEFNYKETWQNMYINANRDDLSAIQFGKISNTGTDKLTEQETEDANLRIELREQMILKNYPPSIKGDFRYFLGQIPTITFLVLLISIMFTSHITVGEFSEGSIKYLLLAPYKRTKILLSKIVIANAFSFFLIFFIAIFSLIIGCFIFDINDLKNNELLMFNKNIISINQIVLLLIRLYISLPGILFAIALTFFIATISKSVIATATLSMFLSLTGETISSVLIHNDSILRHFWIYSNTRIYDQIDSFIIFNPINMIAPSIVVLLYICLLYFISFESFKTFESNT